MELATVAVMVCGSFDEPPPRLGEVEDARLPGLIAGRMEEKKSEALIVTAGEADGLVGAVLFAGAGAGCFVTVDD